MSESKQDIIINLRSLLMPNKKGLPISRIDDEYKEVFGSSFPLVDLGFNSLPEFFSSHPEDFVLLGDNVLPVSKPVSAHIGSLVKNQKPAKKKSVKRIKTNSLCDHCKNKISDVTSDFKRRRPSKRQRRRERRSKLAAEDIIKSIGPKMNTYDPNGWRYAVTIFKNFVNSAKKNQMEVKGNLVKEEDFTSDYISDLRC